MPDMPKGPFAGLAREPEECVMNTIRLEEIRRRLADCGPLDAGAGHDAVALLAEVDRLRAALTRISEHAERCRLACGQGWESTCGCGGDAGHIADAALEGSP